MLSPVLGHQPSDGGHQLIPVHLQVNVDRRVRKPVKHLRQQRQRAAREPGGVETLAWRAAGAVNGQYRVGKVRSQAGWTQDGQRQYGGIAASQLPSPAVPSPASTLYDHLSGQCRMRHSAPVSLQTVCCQMAVRCQVAVRWLSYVRWLSDVRWLSGDCHMSGGCQMPGDCQVTVICQVAVRCKATVRWLSYVRWQPYVKCLSDVRVRLLTVYRPLPSDSDSGSPGTKSSGSWSSSGGSSVWSSSAMASSGRPERRRCGSWDTTTRPSRLRWQSSSSMSVPHSATALTAR